MNFEVNQTNKVIIFKNDNIKVKELIELFDNLTNVITDFDEYTVKHELPNLTNYNLVRKHLTNITPSNELIGSDDKQLMVEYENKVLQDHYLKLDDELGENLD